MIVCRIDLTAHFYSVYAVSTEAEIGPHIGPLTESAVPQMI